MKRWLAIAVVAAGCHAAQASPESDATAVLGKYCGKCHTGPKAQGDFGFATDAAQLVAHHLIVPGDASASPIVRRIEDGEMPPEQVKLRPTPAEVATLRTWIDGMAAETTRPFVREADVATILAADAARLSGEDLRNARWFTLVHLANGNAGDAQLDRTRQALQKLLASLTWAPSPHPAAPVGADRLVYRIDLRELGWSAATWDAIRAQYPYGVARGSFVPDAIRADWFVATASRGALYHAILGMPGTVDELGRRLGVDMATELAAGRVARAGFTGSGVSVNNRVIERYPTRHGALWRSYDFRSSVDIENVFAHPLDFVPAGGEIIFNLPDGMQAYMLVDGAGRRIDKAPSAIVSDPRRPDRAVENAVSCMSCHSAGIIERNDELRDATTGLDDLTQRRVRELYPRHEDMAVLYRADRARFAAALGNYKNAVVDPGAEPISLVTLRYEGELDLHAAAAELGLTSTELAARLARSDDLRRTLGGLAARGGTVKRDAWIAAFAHTLVEASAGIPFTPRAGTDVSPSAWIDRSRRTWLLLDGIGDQATAVEACRRRSLELPKPDELVAAVGDGLAGGLRAAPSDRVLWTAGARLDASNQRFASVVDVLAGTARRADPAERHAVVCVQR